MAKKLTKKRDRKRPFGIIFFVLFFFFFPLIIYVFYSYKYNNSLIFSWSLFRKLDILTIGLMFFPIVVATGLFLVQKWGYILFLAYVALFTMHNFYQAMINPSAYNFATLSFVQVYFFSIFYFVSERIRKPYFKKGFRGWREDERIPLEIKMNVNGEKVTTMELSGGGAQLNWQDCPFCSDTGVKVSFKLWNDEFKLDAGIAWVKDGKVGIAFRNLDKKKRKLIHRTLIRYY